MKRYIGNKQKIVTIIEEFISENQLEATTFADLYAGTGSVSDYFRSQYKIIANDIMHYSYVVLRAKLSFNGAPTFTKFIEEFHKDPINVMNALPLKKDKSMIIWNNFSPKGGRKYFTEENALRIDAARQAIDTWLKDKLISDDEWHYLLACIISSANSAGNTTGTFGAYLKSFSASTLKPLIISHIEPSFGNTGEAYSEPGIELVKRIEADILYLDPPYTAIDYSQAYHFLESLSLYDTNDYKGITGRRVDNQKVSDYTKARTALIEFDNTINLATGCKNVIMSYSSHGIMSLEEVVDVLSKYYKDVVVKEFSYSKYRNVYENKKGTLKELLILGKGRI